MNYHDLHEKIVELMGKHRVWGYSVSTLLKLTVWYAGLVTEAPIPHETRQLSQMAGKQAIYPQLTSLLEEAARHIPGML